MRLFKFTGGRRHPVVDKLRGRILKGRVLTEEPPRPIAAAGSQRELDGQVEALAQRMVDIINSAGPEIRPGLRQYAMDLLRDGTEVGDPIVPAATPDADRRGGNPLGMGLLLGLFSLPMMLLFFPVGLTLLAVALVLSVWGVVAMAVRR